MKLEAASLYTTVYSVQYGNKLHYLPRWTAPGGGGKGLSFGCSLTPRREAPRISGSSGTCGTSDSPWYLAQVPRCTAVPFVNMRLEELSSGPTCTVCLSVCLLSCQVGAFPEVQDT